MNSVETGNRPRAIPVEPEGKSKTSLKHTAETWVRIGRSERRWWLLRGLCAALWAVELFWIQKLPFGVVPWMKYPILVQSFRFGLDLLVALAFVFLLSRRYLIPVLALNLAGLAVIGTYATHFHWPLMPVRAASEFSEGWKMSGNLLGLLSGPTVLVLLAAFAAKVILLGLSGRCGLVPGLRGFTLSLVALLWVLPVLALQFTNLRISARTPGGLGRQVFVYGYLLPWICDVASNGQVAGHQARARQFLDHHYDRLSPLEPSFPVRGHVVVLQLESVDANSISAQCEGGQVMPFLRGLKERSMFFRIQAFHRNGSCDMDYAATTGIEPYPGLVPYRLPKMPYTNTTAQFMEREGYATYFFHGNTALFYDRGPVIEQEGFRHIYFKEQLAGRGLPQTAIGIRDAAVLDLMLEALRNEKRAYLFGITLDTHFPFKQLAPGEMELVAKPKNETERYLNSLRYLDNCLRNFVARAPSGTVVVLYGDHTTSMQTDEFHSDVVDGKEYVGCLVYEKGNDLAKAQRTRSQPVAQDGSLNLLDVMNYLRRCVEAGR
jgi:hypothetical protein